MKSKWEILGNYIGLVTLCGVSGILYKTVGFEVTLIGLLTLILWAIPHNIK